MRVIALGAVLLFGCTSGTAEPCDMSVDDNVSHLVSIIEDEDAWDAWAVELADRCPALHLLVRERLLELAQATG